MIQLELKSNTRKWRQARKTALEQVTIAIGIFLLIFNWFKKEAQSFQSKMQN